jgi:multiple sugar transport system permease protein
MKRKAICVRILIYTLAALIFVIVTFPIYWLFISSLKNESEIIQATPTFLPQILTTRNYLYLLFGSEFLIFMFNSVLVSLSTMLIVTVMSVCASYSLVRLRYPGRKYINRLILLTYIFPGVLLFVPMFQLTNMFGLYDKIISLIIINVTFCAPFATWLLKSFLKTVPKQLEEAAMIDGYSRINVLIRIVVPLIRSGITTIGIYAFLISWGEYMFASVLTTSQTSKTLPVGLASWMTMYTVDWGSLTAGAILVTIPVLILFSFMGKSFVDGLIAGAVKG